MVGSKWLRPSCVYGNQKGVKGSFPVVKHDNPAAILGCMVLHIPDFFPIISSY